MYVYLIFDPFSRLTKIGKSSNPNKRFLAIKTSNPNAELFFYTKEYTESYLHEKFKNKKESGEWFSLNKEDIFSITKTFKCIPKRLYYNNTKKDIIRKEINERKNKLMNHVFTHTLSFAPNYVITEDGKMFNTLRNVEVKKVLKRYTTGFNIQGKFYSLTYLRKQLVKIKKIEVPF